MALVIEGEERIAAPVEKVWDALNDPEILKEAIPGWKGNRTPSCGPANYSNTMLGTAASAAPRSSWTLSHTLAAISR